MIILSGYISPFAATNESTSYKKKEGVPTKLPCLKFFVPKCSDSETDLCFNERDSSIRTAYIDQKYTEKERTRSLIYGIYMHQD